MRRPAHQVPPSRSCPMEKSASATPISCATRGRSRSSNATVRPRPLHDDRISRGERPVGKGAPRHNHLRVEQQAAVAVLREPGERVGLH